MSRIRAGLTAAAAVTIVLLSGCGSGTPTATGAATSGSNLDLDVTDSSTGVTAEPTETAGQPSAEPSTAEKPAKAGPTAIAVSLPSLPIGGSPDDPTAVRQCLQVNYVGPPIPAVVRITVKTAHLAQTGSFYRVDWSSCSVQPPCTAKSFAFTTNTTQCYVGVAATGTTGDADDTAVLTLAAQARCSAGHAKACATFRTAVAAAVQDGVRLTISLEVPTAADSGQSTDSSQTSEPSPTS